MRRRTLGLLALASFVLTACGGDSGKAERPADPDAPLLQVRSEGGFAPIEMVLGRGPTYTLLADGRLIHSGPVIAIYPGPLLPNYLVIQINDDQMNTVLELIDEIGLPDMVEERDEENGENVADATTEVVTYWDAEGAYHRYYVYALGIDPNPPNPSTKAFSELLVVLDQLAASGEAVAYEAERAQVIAGAGFADPDFLDIRDWPLEDTDFSDWETLPNQWTCKAYGPDILDTFSDASQNTQWTHPDPMMDAPPFTLLVRPLHPGEPDCFEV